MHASNGFEFQPEQRAPRQPDPGLEAEDSAALQVLVIDDDPSVLKLTERVIRQGGYAVVCAADAATAMRILSEGQMHIIIADWNMPGMDGLEFLKALRGNEYLGFLYVIMVTANNRQEHVAAAFDAGADDYITKPFDHGELLLRLRAGSRIVSLEQDLVCRNRESLKIAAQMAVLNSSLQRLATTDELTGLVNRREGMTKLSDLWALSARYQLPLSCILADIDYFKKFNDTYGHAVGDEVLKAVARVTAKAVRVTDVVCRLGGEEFLIICPNTPAESALVLAQRLCRGIAQTPVAAADRSLAVTISLGVAERHEDLSAPDQLIHLADTALYESKHAGRNQAVMAGVPAAVG